MPPQQQLQQQQYQRHQRYGQAPPPPQQHQQPQYGQATPPPPQQQYQQQQYQQQQQQQTPPPENAFTSDDFPSGDIEGTAPVSEDAKAKIKARNESPEEEASQGGERFRQMVEKAKSQAQQQPSGYSQPPPQQLQQSMQQQQQQLQQPMTAAASTGAANPMMQQLPPDALNLPIEEQARLFREIMARQQMQQMNRPFPVPQGQPQQQQQQQQYGQQPQYMQQPPPPQQQQQQQQQQYGQPQQQQLYSPPPPPPPPQPANFLAPGVGFDGRKIGRNRDADTIANTADCYFAQLKRDSTTRNFARYSGDDDKANDVFHDPSIQDIEPPETNPYLEDRRKRERDLLETVPEEMLLFQDFEGEDEVDKTFSGISYKDKVAQLRAKRGSNSTKGDNS
ncbi:MAG: hypothetical protein SGILL_005858 [Bacillariaceae sp.]